jgi:hypothetical protein
MLLVEVVEVYTLAPLENQAVLAVAVLGVLQVVLEFIQVHHLYQAHYKEIMAAVHQVLLLLMVAVVVVEQTL